jgi:hypothetical protein
VPPVVQAETGLEHSGEFFVPGRGGFDLAPTGNHRVNRKEVGMYIGIGTVLLIILIVLLVLYVL